MEAVGSFNDRLMRVLHAQLRPARLHPRGGLTFSNDRFSSATLAIVTVVIKNYKETIDEDPGLSTCGP